MYGSIIAYNNNFIQITPQNNSEFNSNTYNHQLLTNNYSHTYDHLTNSTTDNKFNFWDTYRYYECYPSYPFRRWFQKGACYVNHNINNGTFSSRKLMHLFEINWSSFINDWIWCMESIWIDTFNCYGVNGHISYYYPIWQLV